MALSDLVRALEEEAAQRADDLLGGARREAERVRAEAAAEVARRREAMLAGRERELRAAAARRLEAGRRAATARRLEARAQVLARIRRRTEARLASRACDTELLPLVRADFLRALEYAGKGEAVAATSPPLADALRDAVRDLPHVRVEGREDVAGVLLHAADLSWSVDATFSSRLERAWPGLAIDLVRRLEGDR